MRQGAALFQARADRLSGRISIVTHAGLQYGVMRMAGAYSEDMGLEVAVFEKEADALAWLGTD